MYRKNWSRLSWTVLRSLAVYAPSVRSAVNLDGSPAVDPALEEDSHAPAPIDGMDLYWPEQHDCPLPCDDYANIHSWIAYTSVERLGRCKEPMLLQFSASHPLDDPDTTVLIRSCTLGAVSILATGGESIAVVENPKTDGHLLEPSLDIAPACRSEGTRVEDTIHLLQAGSSSGSTDFEASALLDGLRSFFGAADNCDESFVFGYHNNVVASVYIGKGLAKRTAQSAIESLSNHVRSAGAAPRIVAEACSSMHKSEHILGIAIDTTALSTVQKLAFEWSQGHCAGVGGSTSLSAEVWEATPSLRNNITANGTAAGRNGTTENSTRGPSGFIQSVSSLLMGTGSTYSPTANVSSVNQSSVHLYSPTTSMPQSSPAPLSISRTSNTDWTIHTSSTAQEQDSTTDTSSSISITQLSASDRSTRPTEISSLAGHSTGTVSSIRPSSSSKTNLAVDGILSCSGGYRIHIDGHSRMYNNTLSCNGNLTSNGTISCDGIVEALSPLGGNHADLMSNGTLSCNGTLYNNGTIKGAPTSCNGTINILSGRVDAPSSEGTLSCNGTLSGNGTFEAPSNTPIKRQTSGTCSTHLVQNGDTCFMLAQQYRTTVADIESWNKMTWGWQGCADMLIGYIICIGPGGAPMPAPQQGAQCGPLVPGTRPPAAGVSLADLNPCPLKACCSNWGYCGVFPAHCTVNAPPGAAPGAKNKDAQNTCVSNCGSGIRRTSGAPASFGRIGYYSAFAYGRRCLHLPARQANTDGSYTIIHWAFAEIDPTSWTVVINDPGNQWNDFKALQGVKRVISFGGWAYSTEPATFDIIRRAILTNHAAFTDNVAKFIDDEGLDGVDIDWEYPGATDIFVGGQPIGRRTDGQLYLRFLNILRSKIGSNKLLAIAAPASYWYLKAFPIDAMARVLDYIVYMTYDLHGQWDYGNPNAFDQCDSGKCIRSHINLTETDNALGMITKAGVPNNKIFVGEASYGRTFRMAQPGCWGEMCEFTGSREHSPAAPGRCTGTGGYLAMAEIDEILSNGGGSQSFHDSRSNSDIMLHNGDYVSYMTTTTKDTRRQRWRRFNFAGSIDWALDLQKFTASDPPPGESEFPEYTRMGGAYDPTINRTTCNDRQARVLAQAWKDAGLIANAHRRWSPNYGTFQPAMDLYMGVESRREGPGWFSYAGPVFQNIERNYYVHNEWLHPPPGIVHTAYIHFTCDMEGERGKTHSCNILGAAAWEWSDMGEWWDTHTVTFCPMFFRYLSLQQKLAAANGNVGRQETMSEYWRQSTGHVVYHETFHMTDLVSVPKLKDEGSYVLDQLVEDARTNWPLSITNVENYAVAGLAIFLQHEFNLQDPPQPGPDPGDSDFPEDIDDISADHLLYRIDMNEPNYFKAANVSGDLGRLSQYGQTFTPSPTPCMNDEMWATIGQCGNFCGGGECSEETNTGVTLGFKCSKCPQEPTRCVEGRYINTAECRLNCLGGACSETAGFSGRICSFCP